MTPSNEISRFPTSLLLHLPLRLVILEPDSSVAAAPKVKFKIRPQRFKEVKETSVDAGTSDNISSVSHNKKDNTKSDTGEPVVKMHLYHCTHCKMFFSQSESLKDHLRVHHKKRKSAGSSGGGGGGSGAGSSSSSSSNNGHQGK